MAQNMTENSLFLKICDMMGPVNLLLVFLFSSTWQVVPEWEKNEDTKQSCCFGKHLQEECHQKTKVEIRLFSEFTDNKTVCKWRAGLPVTEDSITTICRYHQLFYSDLFFKKWQMLQHLWQSQKEKETRWDTHYNTWNDRTIETQRNQCNSWVEAVL